MGRVRMSGRATAPRQVISASRRTELVGHYADYLAKRLAEIGPERVHTVVLWTKDPSNLLRHTALRRSLTDVGQVFVHWTLTGLGGTFLEPNVPRAQDQLRLMDDIVAYVGAPERVHWRYDPLVSAKQGVEQVGNVTVESFLPLAEGFARAGVTVVHTSFVTMYRKVIRRLAATGVAMSQFAPEERRQILGQLSDAAAGLGLRIQTCCEPGFPVGRCVDGELLRELHPDREPCRVDGARDQRELCGCTVSLDIGRYLPCPNRCLYCYAHPAV